MTKNVNRNDSKLVLGINENKLGFGPPNIVMNNGKCTKSKCDGAGCNGDPPCSKEQKIQCEEFLNSSMTIKDKLCYGVGHVYNDLCASMWFSYLILYLGKVVLFPDSLAGLIVFVGQLADGISTPIVGILSDKQNKIPICAKYGRRKVFHLIGTICITISFPFIFSPTYGIQTGSLTMQSLYYGFFVVIFQFGWASVQISHLALIPDLTPKKSLRTELNSIRYAFTVLANLSVFAITFFVLDSGIGEDDQPVELGTSRYSNLTLAANNSADTTCSTEGTSLQPTDADKFRIIAAICTVVGLVFSFIFHIGVKEPNFQCPKREGRTEIRMKKSDWFKQPPMYIVALLYMATRLYVNLYQAYIPMFVQDTLCLEKTAVATVPFIMYLAGFFASLVMKKLNGVIGRKGSYAAGCAMGISACIWVYVDGSQSNTAFINWGVFVVAMLLGSGGSTLLITSLSITADLIGKNTEGGAFVYGMMSFVDKLSNGVLIMVIQSSNSGLPSYYKDVLFYACGGACVLGLLGLLCLFRVKVGDRRGIAASVCSLMEDVPDSISTSSSSGDGSSSSGYGGHVNHGSDILDTISGDVHKLEEGIATHRVAPITVVRSEQTPR